MKQRSTTPVSKSFVAKASLVAAAVLMAVSGPVQMGSVASADQYDDKINAIQKQVSGYQQEAARLQNEASTLQGKLDQLSSEKSVIQSQIDINQVKYDQLIVKIAETEKKIKDNQDGLGEVLANLYVDDDISPLEMLASSSNISEYLDKQEYRNSIRDTLTQKIGEIKQLKISLDRQRSDVEKNLSQQKAQREVLASKEAEQQKLLADTKGNEAAYQGLSRQANEQIRVLQEQQRAAIAKITGGGKNSAGGVGSFQWRSYSLEQGCTGGFPSSITVNGYTYGCDYGLDETVDEFKLYNRECVSYAAWAAKYRFGKQVGTFNGRGHAYQWTTSGIAESMGADVNDTPAVGAVAIKPRDGVFTYGHAMVVEAVLGDGWIRVSQYNFDMNGTYSTMEVPASSVNYVHFR